MKNKARRFTTYRWTIYSILVIANMISFFHRMSIGATSKYLISTFNMSSVTFANLSSTYFYIYMIMQIPAGILADTIGPRKIISTGTLLAGFGTILFGISANIFQIFLGRLLIGLGVSVVYISVLKTLSNWFKESEFGGIIGLTAALGNFGGILAQTPLVLLMAAITWRNSFIAIGIFTILTSILAYLIIRNSPSDMGFPPIEKSEGKEKNIDEEDKINLWESVKSVFSNKDIWPLFFIFAGFYGAFSSFVGTWGVAYIMEVYELSIIASTNSITLVVLGHIIGAVVIGSISDRMKKRKTPMRFFGFIYLLTWIAVVFWDGGKPPLEFLNIILFTLGFTSATFLLNLSIAKEVNPRKIVGIVTSMVNTGGFLGAAILPPILGIVIDKFKGSMAPIMIYQKAFIFCLMAVLIGNILIQFIKETNCKNVYAEK